MVCAEMSAASTCFSGLEGTDGPSKCACFFLRTDAMMCHGVGFFCVCIVTDDLVLQMASSRPLGASGCGEGLQPHHCPIDGQKLAFFNL